MLAILIASSSSTTSWLSNPSLILKSSAVHVQCLISFNASVGSFHINLFLLLLFYRSPSDNRSSYSPTISGWIIPLTAKWISIGTMVEIVPDTRRCVKYFVSSPARTKNSSQKQQPPHPGNSSFGSLHLIASL